SRSWTSRSKGSSIFGIKECRLPAVSSRRLGSRRSLGLRLASAHEDLSAGTKLEHLAPAAIGLARITTAAPVPDEPVTPVCPMLARHELHQIELNLHRILLFRQAKPLR